MRRDTHLSALSMGGFQVKAKQMVAMTDAITAATIDRLGELDLVENIVIVD